MLVKYTIIGLKKIKRIKTNKILKGDRKTIAFLFLVSKETLLCLVLKVVDISCFKMYYCSIKTNERMF